jgi:phosphohistidine phosphatase
VVACSPLVRARETAEILVRAFARRNASQLQQVEALAPGGNRDELVAWLNTLPSGSTVALVGHEPDLSLLLGHLTSGGEGTYARFGKAGAALVEFAGAVAPGSGELVWLLPPALLRRFGI